MVNLLGDDDITDEQLDGMMEELETQGLAGQGGAGSASGGTSGGAGESANRAPIPQVVTVSHMIQSCLLSSQILTASAP